MNNKKMLLFLGMLFLIPFSTMASEKKLSDFIGELFSEGNCDSRATSELDELFSELDSRVCLGSVCSFLNTVAVQIANALENSGFVRFDLGEGPGIKTWAIKELSDAIKGKLKQLGSEKQISSVLDSDSISTTFEETYYVSQLTSDSPPSLLDFGSKVVKQVDSSWSMNSNVEHDVRYGCLEEYDDDSFFNRARFESVVNKNRSKLHSIFNEENTESTEDGTESTKVKKPCPIFLEVDEFNIFKIKKST